MCESLDISVWDEMTRYAILDNVRNSAVCSSDDRLRVSHGLEEHKTETFSPAGQSEDFAVCVAGEKFLGRQAVEKMCAF